MNNDTRDPLDRVAALRPTPAHVEGRWSDTSKAAVLDRVMTVDTAHADTADGETLGTLVAFRPRRSRRAVLAPLAAGAATVAAIATAVALVGASHPAAPNPTRSAARPHAAPRVAADPGVGSGQFTYAISRGYVVASAGQLTLTERFRNWVSPTGEVWTAWTDRASGQNKCLHYPAVVPATFETPNQAFFRLLPTDEAGLADYLRRHASGGSTTEQSVFFAARDSLATAGGLASRALRRAFVAVLSDTAHVTVHRGAAIPGGATAIRFDFADPARLPGKIESLYFDPTTYEMVAGGNGSARAADGSVSTSTVTKVVDKLPAALSSCPKG